MYGGFSMKKVNCVLVLCASITASLTVAAGATPAQYSVRDFGAAGNGKTKDTSAIQSAIDACAKAGGGTVYLPAGQYLTGAIQLRSHIIFELGPGAVILGSEDPADYPLRDNAWGGPRKSISSLIYAEDVEDLTITGRGTINGQGQIWWKRQWLAAPKAGMPAPSTPADFDEIKKLANGRPQLIGIVRGKHLVIEKVHLINSASWTIHPLFCEFVRVDGITIENPVPSPNTDGINPESCRNVQIMNSRIDVGDDCVTLKSGINEVGRKMGKPDENITITNCVMLKGHGGVTIGSEMSGGVRNVVVSNCVFQGTQVGIRVKSQRGRGAVVEGLSVSNIVMQDVLSAFTITTFYAGSDKPGDVFPLNEGTPRFRDFVFSNITARGSKTAGQITGLKELPVEDILFSNVRIQAETGFTVTNAKNIFFRDTIIDTETGPALTVVNSTGLDTSRLITLRPHPGVPLIATDSAAH
jgi:polygalacturonase